LGDVTFPAKISSIRTKRKIEQTSTSNSIAQSVSKQAAVSNTSNAPKPTRDFFGRIITKPQTSHAVVEKLVSDSPTKRATLRFKFQEGFTNAVRRPVFLADLL